MLVTAQKSKKTKKMLIILGIVFVCAVFFNFYLSKKFFVPSREDTGEEFFSSFGADKNNLGSAGSERISLGILENETYINLKKIGDWPVVVRLKGRINPFLKPQLESLGQPPTP